MFTKGCFSKGWSQLCKPKLIKEGNHQNCQNQSLFQTLLIFHDRKQKWATIYTKMPKNDSKNWQIFNRNLMYRQLLTLMIHLINIFIKRSKKKFSKFFLVKTSMCLSTMLKQHRFSNAWVILALKSLLKTENLKILNKCLKCGNC